MTIANTPSHWGWLILLCSTIIVALTFEHSQLDVYISELFYANGHWLLEKGAQPYAFIFYDFPKLLLIVLAVYLITILIIKYNLPSNTPFSINKSKFDRMVIPLSVREISCLLIILIVVPTLIATLKGITHVSCPNQLRLFNGDLPYLNLWQDMNIMMPTRCFPAAHASAGFALYGFAYLPSLKKQRVNIIILASILGWTMGLYKMFIGDHFFSHTLVSMLLSWTIAYIIAMIFFPKTIELC